MARLVGGCVVEFSVVIANESTQRKMEQSILEIAEAVEDYPFLQLDDAVERLIEAFEELEYEPA